jgi:hypothetical protein
MVFLLSHVCVLNISAQDAQCGTLDTITMPIDTHLFEMVQPFGISSPRHQGSYHTGEDWFSKTGDTLGQPVRTIGRGMVTYSNPRAWGDDGGVVIIRHTLPDGSTIYSQYGYLTEGSGVAFPVRLTCVDNGEVIGLIGDGYPAPHLHFEMRVPISTNSIIGEMPGSRYSQSNPRLGGWRRPTQVMRNLDARLADSAVWYSVTTEFDRLSAPLLLNDNSMLVIDGDRLRRVTADGRVLWRVALPRPAVGLHGHQSQSFVTYQDGSVTQVNVESGALGSGWQINDFFPDFPPITTSQARIYHTSDQTLTAINLDQREIVWQAQGIPLYDHAITTGRLIGLIIGRELWVLNQADGTFITKVTLTDGAGLSAHPDGDLVAYTWGGLWRIDEAGNWSLLVENTPHGGDGHGAVVLSDGRVYITDHDKLYAYNAEGVLSWESPLPRTISGRIAIVASVGTLIITSSHGDIVVMRDNGMTCGQTGLYGDDTTALWYTLSADGLLRVSIGDQLMGFNFERLTAGC